MANSDKCLYLSTPRISKDCILVPYLLELLSCSLVQSLSAAKENVLVIDPVLLAVGSVPLKI